MTNPFNILGSAWKVHQQEEGITLSEADSAAAGRIASHLSAKEKEGLMHAVQNGMRITTYSPGNRVMAKILARRGLAVGPFADKDFGGQLYKLTATGKRVAMYLEYSAAHKALTVSPDVTGGAWKVVARLGSKSVSFRANLSSEDIAYLIRSNRMWSSGIGGHFWGDIQDKMGGGVRKINRLLDQAFRSGRYDWLEGVDVVDYSVQPRNRTIVVQLSD